MSETDRNEKLAPVPFAEAGEPVSRDAYLCYCLDVTHDDFKRGVWQQPDLSFTDVCARMGVGTKCTACLLNAENLYYIARRERPADFVAGAFAKRKTKSWNKQRLYALLDAAAPSVGTVIQEVVPVFAAPGITTTMTIANSVSSSIGARSARFKGNVAVYDAAGHLAGTQSFAVPQGDRADITVSDMLAGAPAENDYLIGSCWVERMPQGSGYRGSIRGHFTVRTPRGTTALHAQEPQKPGTRTFMTTRLNAEEDQFLSLVNCADRSSCVKVRISLLHGDDDGQELSADIVAYGCVLLPLPRLGVGSKEHIHVVNIDSEQRFRSHLLIRSDDGLQLSFDHV
jgi:bacterioferritin-associated ferredoxin